jgi:hypothetical protein
LFEGIQDKVGVQRGRHPPADDAAGEDIQQVVISSEDETPDKF